MITTENNFSESKDEFYSRNLKDESYFKNN